uniref:G protein signaling modulator 3 n=1 Tax=Salvator merianae TaxID=96440 RepID=A0A8D0BW81_SALMN
MEARRPCEQRQRQNPHLLSTPYRWPLYGACWCKWLSGAKKCVCVCLTSLSVPLPVFFSSLTSLQAEEFFDMVAKVQARRLNDQRADFAGAEEIPAETSAVSEDQLYDTILAHQSKRLEDQRTEPPIPVGIQGLLDLLLRAQGTRMEDQRSTLPPGPAVPSLLTQHSSIPT